MTKGNLPRPNDNFDAPLENWSSVTNWSIVVEEQEEIRNILYHKYRP